jgi:hypothetical protein
MLDCRNRRLNGLWKRVTETGRVLSVVFNPNADYEINADLNESGGIVGIEILALGAEELGALSARLGSDVVPALCELAK